MKKLFFILVLLFGMFTGVNAGLFFTDNGIVINTGTVTSSLPTDTVWLPEIDILDYSDIGFWFKIITPDTLKADSLTGYIIGGERAGQMGVMYTFALAVADTATKYKYFPHDSIGFAYPFQRLAKPYFVFNDDNTASEVLRPTGNGTTHDWYTSNADSGYYGVINESTVDTTDFDSTSAYNKWLVVTCGDHVAHELTADSIKVVTRGGSQVAAASFKFGVTLADTAYALRLLSDSTLMAVKDTGTYSKVFATNPYGTTWTAAQTDSLGIILQSLKPGTGGVCRVAQGYITVYWHKGVLSPSIQWEQHWILKK